MSARPAPPSELFALYRQAPFGDRFHIRTRWLACPFRPVSEAVPRTGRILDVGCGHGLFSFYLGLQAPDRHITGIDIDAHKIAIARQAAARLDRQPPDFDDRADGTIPEGPWDAIVITDVLYLLDRAGRERLIEDCAHHVAPGGVIVIKELGIRPRWKYHLAVAQETLATRVLRITAGSHLDISDPLELVDLLRSYRFTVAAHRLDHHRPHAHVLVTAERTEQGTDRVR